MNIGHWPEGKKRSACRNGFAGEAMLVGAAEIAGEAGSTVNPIPNKRIASNLGIEESRVFRRQRTIGL